MDSSTEVLIFDDDRLMGQMAGDVLQDLGYSYQHKLNGNGAIDEVRAQKPRLVLLDIMMPGLDGLSLCRAMRSQPDLAGVKIVVVTAKSPETEGPRALKAGADGFLHKPYDVEELKTLVAKLLGEPRGWSSGTAQRRAAVKFWGCRGHFDKPLEASAFGRQSSCVSLSFAGIKELFVLDAGSGIAALAQSLAADFPPAMTLLLSHYHQDHVSGLAQLDWAARAGLSLRVLGPSEPEVDLAALVNTQLQRGAAPKARVQVFCVGEQAAELSPGVKLSALYAQHPTNTLAFALEANGVKIAYCPDSELVEDEEELPGDYEEKLTNFCRGADLLIHDAHFSPEERARPESLGHSSWKAALRLAVEAGARRLALFHLGSHIGDTRLAALEAEAKEAAAAEMATLECFMAREGLEIAL